MTLTELANSLEANLERYGPQLSVGEQEWRLIIKALRENERMRAALQWIEAQVGERDTELIRYEIEAKFLTKEKKYATD